MFCLWGWVLEDDTKKFPYIKVRLFKLDIKYSCNVYAVPDKSTDQKITLQKPFNYFIFPFLTEKFWIKLKLLVVFILILSETLGRVSVTFTQPVETLPILLVMRSWFWKVEDILFFLHWHSLFFYFYLFFLITYTCRNCEEEVLCEREGE